MFDQEAFPPARGRRRAHVQHRDSLKLPKSKKRNRFFKNNRYAVEFKFLKGAKEAEAKGRGPFRSQHPTAEKAHLHAVWLRKEKGVDPKSVIVIDKEDFAHGATSYGPK